MFVMHLLFIMAAHLLSALAILSASGDPKASIAEDLLLNGSALGAELTFHPRLPDGKEDYPPN